MFVCCYVCLLLCLSVAMFVCCYVCMLLCLSVAMPHCGCNVADLDESLQGDRGGGASDRHRGSDVELSPWSPGGLVTKLKAIVEVSCNGGINLFSMLS